MGNGQDNLQVQLGKRLSINLLIQGAASHTYLTAHHLVRNQLDAIEPGFVNLYDKVSLSVQLSQWIGDLVLIVGSPKEFWKTTRNADHPFSACRFLVEFGGYLASESKKYTVARAKEKGVSPIPGVQYAQAFWLLGRTFMKEKKHRIRLAEIGKIATSQIWEIDSQRLHGTITGDVEFGQLQIPRTRAGKFLRMAAAGYGGVHRTEGGDLQVRAKAWMWPLLVHELTKGTAELVCLHSLKNLDESTYRYVTEIADAIELEIWMMQAGGHLWRLFLKAIPPSDENNLLANALMHVALMDPEQLHHFLVDLIQHPQTARGTLADCLES